MGRIIADPYVPRLLHHSGVAGIPAGWQLQAFFQVTIYGIWQAKGPSHFTPSAESQVKD